MNRGSEGASEPGALSPLSFLPPHGFRRRRARGRHMPPPPSPPSTNVTPPPFHMVACFLGGVGVGVFLTPTKNGAEFRIGWIDH